MPIASGSLLAGKYRLLESIGRGGMGEVFAASHAHTGAEVAIKIVSRSRSSDVFMQRLHREAVAAGRIRSDFVPRVHDVDRTEDGELFLVMERLHGESLAERLRARATRPVEWDEVRRIGDDLLSGLIDAHAAGIVHRDLKPANVFLVARRGAERAFILDFGVCKFDLPDTERLTTTGESVGTVAYMAPEQIRGASRVDERADLYAFGVVVFEALGARLPYDATGQVAMIASKLERRARSLEDDAQVAFPPGLDALVARALARRPEDRFGSAEEMRTAWRALGAATTAPRPQATHAAYPGVGSPPDAPATMTTATVERVAYGSRGSRLGRLLAACALGVACVVAVATLLATARERDAAPRSAPVAALDVTPASDVPGPSPPPDTRAPTYAGAGLGAGAADAGSIAPPPRRQGATHAGTRGAGAGAPAKRTPGAPHITTEPRY